jgi:hypothetical protein
MRSRHPPSERRPGIGAGIPDGFGNIEATLACEFLQNAPHELLISVGR